MITEGRSLAKGCCKTLVLEIAGVIGENFAE